MTHAMVRITLADGEGRIQEEPVEIVVPVRPAMIADAVDRLRMTRGPKMKTRLFAVAAEVLGFTNA